MRAVDIWVEGTADQKFLADALKVWFGLAFDKRFECNDTVKDIGIRIRTREGVSSYNTKKGWNNTKPFFEENELTDVTNLIIVDADKDFEKQKNTIANVISGVRFNPENHLFLIPDHQNNGNLETLLEQIINPEHKILFECWNAYETCLKSKEAREYTLPPRKAKIYAYLEALLSEKEKQKIKPEERDYSDPEHWTLNHTKEPLKHLYQFLNKHLMSPSGIILPRID